MAMALPRAGRVRWHVAASGCRPPSRVHVSAHQSAHGFQAWREMLSRVDARTKLSFYHADDALLGAFRILARGVVEIHRKQDVLPTRGGMGEAFWQMPAARNNGSK